MFYLTGLLFGCVVLVNWAANNVNQGYAWTDRFCGSDAGVLCQNPKSVLAAAVVTWLIALYRYITRSRA